MIANIELEARLSRSRVPPLPATFCNLLFTPTSSVSALRTGANMLGQENNWQPRPRKLIEFTTDTQIRLKQLDFNRTILVHDIVYDENKALNVKRTGLNQFWWSEAAG